jgi:hypothetical protein
LDGVKNALAKSLWGRIASPLPLYLSLLSHNPGLPDVRRIVVCLCDVYFFLEKLLFLLNFIANALHNQEIMIKKIATVNPALSFPFPRVSNSNVLIPKQERRSALAA